VIIAVARFFLKKPERGFFFAAGSAGMNTRWNISKISWTTNLKVYWPISAVIGFDCKNPAPAHQKSCLMDKK
jgi:hypothetical protein